jgi:peptidoglycan/LPS O-acetylase OafA/YrhL
VTSTASRPARVVASAPAAPIGHRGEIQGLRAVAVLLVVLGHAGVPGLAGGYVGVDVFFVISGFLITTLLVREHRRAGRISLARFYARRAVRLLPAATLVAVSTMVAAWLWLPPARMAGIAYDALATAGYAVNVRFAAVATDYFANPAPSPFQHFWSLAVEEQFYLLWPLLILVVVRRGRRLAVVLGLLCAISLAYSQHRLTGAYFDLPSRAWELGAGALLALRGDLGRMSTRGRALVSFAGLAAIGWAAVGYSATTAFPGVAALLPVLGAVAVIAAGPVGAGRLLSLRPLQFAGTLSYGWYLWHWPLLVIGPAVIGRELGLVARLGLVAAGLLLAFVTYHSVENPVRRRRALVARPARGLALGLALSATTAALAAAALACPPHVPVTGAARKTVPDKLSRLVAAAQSGRGIPANLTPALDEAHHDASRPQTDGCHQGITGPARQPPCTYGPGPAGRTVVLFGDSHALQWFPAFEDLAARYGWRLVSLTRSSCSPAAVPVRNVRLNRPYTECDRWRESSLRRIRELAPRLVVVTSSTAYPGLLAGRPADPERLWTDAWQRLLTTLRADAGRVALIEDTPMLHGDPLDCVSTHADDIAACAEPAGTALRNPAWRAEVADAARRAGVPVIGTRGWLCAASCPIIVGNLLVYRDNNHLTSAYVKMLGPLLARSLALPPW